MVKKAAGGIYIGLVYGIYILLLEDGITAGIAGDHFTGRQALASLIIYVFGFIIAALAVNILAGIYWKVRRRGGEIAAVTLTALPVFLLFCLIYERAAGYFMGRSVRFYLFLCAAAGAGGLVFYGLARRWMSGGRNPAGGRVLMRAVGYAAGFSALLVVGAETWFSPYIRYMSEKIGFIWYAAGIVMVWGIFMLAREVSRIFIAGAGGVSGLRLRRSIAAAALLVVIAAYGSMVIAWKGVTNCRVEEKYVSNGESPNVIFILIDALRADRVGVYGNGRDLTPNTDKYSRRGTVFENSLANSSWTKPSVASYFTGRYAGMNPAHSFNDRFPDTLRTIAERLQEAGYYTRAISENMNVSEKYNYHQGFADFLFISGIERKQLLFPPQLLTLACPHIVELCYRWGLLDDGDGTMVNKAVLPWLKANKDKKYFLYIHYMGPHIPYYPLKRRYSAGEGLRAGDLRVLKTLRSPAAGRKLSGRALRILKDRYDDEVWEADMRTGELFSVLDKIGGWENTVVIFTADHGEEFLEHGMGDHGNSMFQELIKVPLIIWLPKGGNRTQRVEAGAELLDLAATIDELCVIQGGEELAGYSLVPLMKGDSAAFGGWGRGYYGEVHPFRKVERGDRIYAYMRDEFKLVKNEFDDRPEADYVLYNMRDDAGETVNAADVYPEVFQRMKAGLDSMYEYCRAHYVEGAATDKVRNTEEDLRRLRALGYAK